MKIILALLYPDLISRLNFIIFQYGTESIFATNINHGFVIGLIVTCSDLTS